MPSQLDRKRIAQAIANASQTIAVTAPVTVTASETELLKTTTRGLAAHHDVAVTNARGSRVAMMKRSAPRSVAA